MGSRAFNFIGRGFWLGVFICSSLALITLLMIICGFNSPASAWGYFETARDVNRVPVPPHWTFREYTIFSYHAEIEILHIGKVTDSRIVDAINQLQRAGIPNNPNDKYRAQDLDIGFDDKHRFGGHVIEITTGDTAFCGGHSGSSGVDFPFGPSMGTYQSVRIRLWVPTFLLLSLAVLSGVMAYRRRAISCTYDLTGNVSGICPECGERVAKHGRADAVTLRRRRWLIVVPAIFVAAMAVYATIDPVKAFIFHLHHPGTAHTTTVRILDAESGKMLNEVVGISYGVEGHSTVNWVGVVADQGQRIDWTDEDNLYIHVSVPGYKPAPRVPLNTAPSNLTIQLTPESPTHG